MITRPVIPDKSSTTVLGKKFTHAGREMNCAFIIEEFRQIIKLKSRRKAAGAKENLVNNNSIRA